MITSFRTSKTVTINHALIGLFLLLISNAHGASVNPITFDHPGGGEVYISGQTQRFQIHSKLRDVTLELSRDGGLTFEPLGIVKNTIQTDGGAFVWIVSGGVTKNAVVRASAIYRKATVSINSSAFTIDNGASLGGQGVLTPGIISNEYLADGSVTTPKLAAAAVTNEKIADLSVSSQKISSGQSSENFVLTADGFGGASWIPPMYMNLSGSTAGGDLAGTYPNPSIATTSTAGANIIAAVNASSATLNGSRVQALSVGVNAGVIPSSGILDMHIAGNAQISGSKVMPNFGTQNIFTSGSFSAVGGIGHQLTANGGDNVLEIKQANAANAGQSAIRFLDKDGNERCAMGYGNLRGANPFNQLAFVEIGALTIANLANPTGFGVVNTHGVNGGSLPQGQYPMLKCGEDGSITFNAATPYFHPAFTMDPSGNCAFGNTIIGNASEGGPLTTLRFGGNGGQSKYGLGTGSGYLMMSADNYAVGTQIGEYDGTAFTPRFFVSSGSYDLGAGYVGVGTSSPRAQFQTTAGLSTTMAVIVKGAGGQSADLQRWTDSADVTLAKVTSTGIIGSMAVNLSPAATPTAPATSADGNIYIKGGKLIVQYNDAGTVRYKYLDLTGTGVLWTQTTTAP